KTIAFRQPVLQATGSSFVHRRSWLIIRPEGRIRKPAVAFEAHPRAFARNLHARVEVRNTKECPRAQYGRQASGIEAEEEDAAMPPEANVGAKIQFREIPELPHCR